MFILLVVTQLSTSIWVWSSFLLLPSMGLILSQQRGLQGFPLLASIPFWCSLQASLHLHHSLPSLPPSPSPSTREEFCGQVYIWCLADTQLITYYKLKKGENVHFFSTPLLSLYPMTDQCSAIDMQTGSFRSAVGDIKAR